MYAEDFLFLIIIALALGVLCALVVTGRRRSGNEAAASKTKADYKDRTVSDAAQLVEDIKAIQTSHVDDQIAILEDLSSTNSNYRQYCELIGTTQSTSSVTAPYSKRGVAYYDVRCFKVEHLNGRDVETLVAHEKSIDPFYFMDSSCDIPVYVDLASFENNVILVNSKNQMEGPTSEFSEAFAANIKSGGSSGRAYAVAQGIAEKGSNLLQTLKQNASGLFQQPQPALAYATVGAADGSEISLPVQRTNVFFAYGRPGGMGMGYGPSMGRPGRGSFDPGYYPDLGSFLGGSSSRKGGYYGGTSTGEVLLGMGLGALLGTLMDTGGSDNNNQAPDQQPTTSFRGYRLVEDIVPLNYPVYCLGELYKNGRNYYMGCSVSETYPSSFFATKPETEVINELHKKM